MGGIEEPLEERWRGCVGYQWTEAERVGKSEVERRQLTFLEDLLCAVHCPKGFMYLKSFNPNKKPEMQMFSPFYT